MFVHLLRKVCQTFHPKAPTKHNILETCSETFINVKKYKPYCEQNNLLTACLTPFITTKEQYYFVSIHSFLFINSLHTAVHTVICVWLTNPNTQKISLRKSEDLFLENRKETPSKCPWYGLLYIVGWNFQ